MAEFFFDVVLAAFGLIGLAFLTFVISAGLVGLKEHDDEIREKRRRAGGKIKSTLLIAIAMTIVYRDYRQKRCHTSTGTPRRNRATARTPQ